MLREWRKVRRLPLKAVAADIGVGITVVSQWETGMRVPRLEDFIRISELTHLPPCALVGLPCTERKAE